MVPLTNKTTMYQLQKLLKGVSYTKLKSPVTVGNYKRRFQISYHFIQGYKENER